MIVRWISTTVFEELGGPRGADTVSLFAIPFCGKLVILEVVSFVFGDDVELGHFIEVAALVLALMITRRLFEMSFRKPGVPAAETGDN